MDARSYFDVLRPFRGVAMKSGSRSKEPNVKLLNLGMAFSVGALLTLVVASPASAGPAGHGQSHRSARTCAAATGGNAACNALVVLDSAGKPTATSTPTGLGPANIRSAYALTGSAGSGRIVAIVDAYNDPDRRSRSCCLPNPIRTGAVHHREQMLPQGQPDGGTKLPRTNAGWATEISLDLDMVSAACPDCRILLVEATSASFTNLGAGVNYAATQGVTAISNSYGGSDSTQSSAYDHPGIAVTASTGDGGYGIESPASFPSVVAVGGTSLTKASTSRGWTESAWNGAGSGCSTLNAKPSWQTAVTACSGKANADVSAVADPNTGVAVYDSTPYQGASGWQVYGGTSAASPIIASVYALSGNTSGYPASYTWAHTSALNDVTTGSNGSCSPSIWCHATTGWDGPTGLGTPNGTAGF